MKIVEILFIFLIGIFISCGGIKTVSKTESIFPDSLFAFKGIENTEILTNLDWDWENLYLDSTNRIRFCELNNANKINYLTPVIELESEWIKEDIKAFFISKQQKIGDIQPIIIQTYGTGYSSLILINLNRNNEFISGMILNGGENSGPMDETDSTVVLRPENYCRFNKNVIKWYSLNKILVKKNKDDYSTVCDSIIYKTIIKENGKLETLKLDSIRKNIENEN